MHKLLALISVMQCTTGSTTSNEVHHASCSNGMFCKFNTLLASKQAVHNKVVRQCSDPWQWCFNMHGHMQLDDVHKNFSTQSSDVNAWTLSMQQDLILVQRNEELWCFHSIMGTIICIALPLALSMPQPIHQLIAFPPPALGNAVWHASQDYIQPVCVVHS